MENYCVFVPCGKRKVNHKTEARNMYVGSYFKECYNTANLIYPESRIYILSAKYGVLKTTDLIEPYDITFKNMNKKDREEYKRKINEQLKNMFSKDIQLISFLPKKYNEFIEDYFINKISIFEGISGMGDQKHVLKELREIYKK